MAIQDWALNESGSGRPEAGELPAVCAADPVYPARVPELVRVQQRATAARNRQNDFAVVDGRLLRWPFPIRCTRRDARLAGPTSGNSSCSARPLGPVQAGEIGQGQEEGLRPLAAEALGLDGAIKLLGQGQAGEGQLHPS